MLEMDLNRVGNLSLIAERRTRESVWIKEVKCLVKRLEDRASIEELIGRLTCTDDTALVVTENEYFRCLMED